MRLPRADFRHLTFIIILSIAPQALLAACAPDLVTLRGTFGQIDFRVEIADDPEERAVGLMNRPQMDADAGMLFVYERAQPLAFWMRNTLIPLDMLFIDPDGRVGFIHENAIPLDETPIEGGPGRIAVLEINGGLTRELGIGVGAELRHPDLDQDTSLWPCSE